ncbi:hypothetical protein ES703_125851 [subsurface metagenome]
MTEFRVERGVNGGTTDAGKIVGMITFIVKKIVQTCIVEMVYQIQESNVMMETPATLMPALIPVEMQLVETVIDGAE